MDVDSSQRQMAAYLRDHQDKLVGRWTELVVADLRGQSSAAEVRRELEDLYSLLSSPSAGLSGVCHERPPRGPAPRR